MELLTEKEALMIQECIEFVLKANAEGCAEFKNGAVVEDLENLLKKLRGER